MKNTRGFTLLELLVVVLIIGILAAIALPQYQITTKVAKIKGLYPAMRALVEARTNYYFMHNTWTTDMNLLDVDVPYNRKEGNTYYTDWGWFEFRTDTGTGAVKYQVDNTNVTISFQYGHYTMNYGRMNQGYCFAPKDDARANRICEKLGVYQTNSNDSKVYLFR